MTQAPTERAQHHVVIVGGGFAGLYTAKSLADTDVQVTLIDKRNFHLFQPLLYQVASGSLSPGDIAAPLRAIVRKHPNIRVLLNEVTGFEPDQKVLNLKDGTTLNYDTVVWAAGGTHQYFGHPEWQQVAPGLKTLEDALQVRQKILLALEEAEKLPPEQQSPYLNFVIVGGGPTGVEMAGTLAELVHKTFRQSFRNLKLSQIRIYLVEAGPGILGTYPKVLVEDAVQALEKLGVTVYSNWMVEAIEPEMVRIRQQDNVQTIPTKTVLWTAGVKASPLGAMIAEKTGTTLDRLGRVTVETDFTLPSRSDIYVVGDLACHALPDQPSLPCLASVALQSGQYVGKTILKRLNNETIEPFQYHDKGTMAIIGKNKAVADLGHVQLKGFPAWFIWLFVHIFLLVGFDNKVVVMFQWIWNYLTRGRTACLITEAGKPVLS